MKTTVAKIPGFLKVIDKQLQKILENDIRKMKEEGNRNAAFLQLIAA